MKSNALFIQRFGAFIIDIFIISMIATIISTPLINTSNNEKLSKQSSELVNKMMSGEIDQKTYVQEAGSISYQIDRNNGFYTIINIVLGILYFIVFQFLKGQTIGKKLFKIKVASNEDELTMNQMVVRGLVIDMMLFQMIRFAFCLFSKPSTYFIGYSSVLIVEIIVLGLCGFMVMLRKDRRGLHDIICNTKVINVK